MIIITITSTTDTPVFCYSNDSVNCMEDGANKMPYAECCTKQGAENIYYSTEGSTGQCTICGEKNHCVMYFTLTMSIVVQSCSLPLCLNFGHRDC